MARRRSNFFGKRNRLKRGSNLSDEGATEKIEEILSEECGSRKLEAVPSAKSAESLVVAREADRWALLPRSPDVYMASRRSHDRDETLSRSFARVSRSTHPNTWCRARARDATTFILKPSHALLDDHTLWDPINEPEISQRPLIKHENRILWECSEE